MPAKAGNAMAIYTPGPLIGNIAGSVGGCVFSRSRGAPTIRRRSTPTDPITPAQQSIRSTMAAVAKLWPEVLSQAERDGWNALAEITIRTNRLGIQHRTSGFALFTRANFLGVQHNRPWYADAPEQASGPSPIILTEWNEPAGRMIANVAPDQPTDQIFAWYVHYSRARTIDTKTRTQRWTYDNYQIFSALTPFVDIPVGPEHPTRPARYFLRYNITPAPGARNEPQLFVVDIPETP